MTSPVAIHNPFDRSIFYLKIITSIRTSQATKKALRFPSEGINLFHSLIAYGAPSRDDFVKQVVSDGENCLHYLCYPTFEKKSCKLESEDVIPQVESKKIICDNLLCSLRNP